MSNDFWFLLLPGFSLMGFISAVEPLRVANRFRGGLYRWHLLSVDGGPVLAAAPCVADGASRASRIPLAAPLANSERHKAPA